MIRQMLNYPDFPKQEEPETDRLGFPVGMVEYSVRTSIRDLMRIYGFENARAIVAEVINEEASGRRT